ncbi:MAG: hypothetical protein IGQ45_10835 [Cyanobacterium sp. T60_A2020_053]|nr:hypothetical protein [Cyanobacterium sp. T60_A2020_053]
MLRSKILSNIILSIILLLLTIILFFISGIKDLIGGIFLSFIAFICAQFPRTSLYFFLIYLCFGGTIIYLFPSSFQQVGEMIRFGKIYPVLQIIKDIFYFPALITIIFTLNWRQFYQKIKPFCWALAVFTFICFLTFFFVNFPQQFAVTDGSPILMGILGLKVWLGYIPLLLCSIYLVNNYQQLILITRLQIILIIICCFLTLFQYYALLNNLCVGSVDLPGLASSRASLQARCLVGGALLFNPELNLIRLPGTFVAPWQWGWFLISSIFFTVAGTIIEKDKIWRYLGWFSSAFVILTTFISGQRIAIFLVPFFFIILFIFTENNRRKLSLKLRIFTAISLISLTIPLIQTRIAQFGGRWAYSSPISFTQRTLNYAIDNQNGLFGNGLGTTYSGARKLGDIQLIEIFPAQLIYEMGFIGLISFFIMVTFIVYLGWKSYLKIENKSLKKFAFCLWLFVIFISYNPYYYPLIVDPINIYYWLMAGILLNLPSIDNIE